VADLLIACGGGSEAALATLFDVLYPTMAALARTEDEVIAAFCTIWRRAPEYTGVGNAIEWILTVTEQCLDRLPVRMRDQPATTRRAR
jgi:hypothetical protein